MTFDWLDVLTNQIRSSAVLKNIEMADNKTPESEKTVSRTDDQQLSLEGPTPKNDKKFGNQR